jgi:putative acetyltransferase
VHQLRLFQVRITVARALAVTPDIVDLVHELETTLAASYPPEQRHGIPIERLFEPHVHFYVARLDGAAVGCGAFALSGDHAEVKRMFTKPALRGRGVARALLSHIESDARQAGFAMLQLETGIFQPEAIRLYEAYGFRRCEAFGPYRDMPAQAIETSLFYEKAL